MKTTPRLQILSTPSNTKPATPQKRKAERDWYQRYVTGAVSEDEFIIPDHPKVEVKQYEEGTWVVLLQGVLLVMTPTERGAKAVKRIIDGLSQRIKELKGAAMTDTVQSLVKAPQP